MVQLSFEELLKKIILRQCITGIYNCWPNKCLESTIISLNIMTEVFPMSPPLYYNITHQPDFSTRPVKSVYYSPKSLGCLGPMNWKLVTARLKNGKPLEALKLDIEKWERKTALSDSVRHSFTRRTLFKISTLISYIFLVYILFLFFRSTG